MAQRDSAFKENSFSISFTAYTKYSYFVGFVVEVVAAAVAAVVVGAPLVCVERTEWPSLLLLLKLMLCREMCVVQCEVGISPGTLEHLQPRQNKRTSMENRFAVKLNSKFHYKPSVI